MIFTTQLELNITIKDVNAMYSVDYNQMLIEHARLMYNRTCRDGQYIKSIDRLVKRSLPNLIKRDLTAKVRVYIVVEATVIRYDQYDIVSGMTVSKIIPAGKIGNFDMIECRNDHVITLMKIKKGVESFKVNDKIPIRVGQSMYKIGNQHILINGYPFLPYVPESTTYSIGVITPEDKEYYNSMTKPLIERELARRDTLDKTTIDRFTQLLYPYKTAVSKNTKASEEIDIFDIDAITTGLYEIDYRANFNKLKITKSSKNKGLPSSAVITNDTKFVLTRLAYQYVKHLETINDLSEEYTTDDAFNNVSYIWEIYESHKFE